MAKQAIQIRVDATDLEQWVAESKALGISLSEWIRRRCNGQIMGTVTQGIAAEREYASPKKRGKAASVPVAKPTGGDSSGSTPHSAHQFCKHEVELGKICFPCGGYAKEG